MRLNRPTKRMSLLSLVSMALLLLLPSYSAAGSPKAAPPAPPAPEAAPAPPSPPEAPEPPGGGWLGVVLSGEEGGGVTIREVREESPAEKAGLKEGDRILEMDGRKITTPRDVRRTLRNLEPGDTLQIKVRRGSQEKTLTATVGKPPEDALPGLRRSLGDLQWATPDSLPFAMLGMMRNYLGVRVLPMTEDLRAYFKTPRGRGILVSRVEEDTPAAKAGMRAGDVIVAVDGKGISDRSDIAQALADRQPGDKVPVKIVRDGSEKTLEVEIGERPGAHRHGAFVVPEDEQPDLERLQELSNGVAEEVRNRMEEAREELKRAAKEAASQKRAVLKEWTDLSDAQISDIRQQVRDAMRQAKEAIREATEAVANAPL